MSSKKTPASKRRRIEEVDDATGDDVAAFKDSLAGMKPIEVHASSDMSAILRKVRSLAEEESQKWSQPSEQITLHDLGLSGVTKQVEDLSDDQVVVNIEDLVLFLVSSIMAEQGIEYAVPSGGNSNLLYVRELDRIGMFFVFL